MSKNRVELVDIKKSYDTNSFILYNKKSSKHLQSTAFDHEDYGLCSLSFLYSITRK